MSTLLAPIRRFVTAYHVRRKAKERRIGLTAQRLCLNGASHGRATHGRRCALCAAVHTYGKAALSQPFTRVLMLERELVRIGRIDVTPLLSS